MMLLIVLELIVIKLFLIIGVLMFIYMYDSLLIFIFIIITASEAGVGVSLLTTFVRSQGNDFVIIRLSQLRLNIIIIFCLHQKNTYGSLRHVVQFT